jgi:hypothetical protein
MMTELLRWLQAYLPRDAGFALAERIGQCEPSQSGPELLDQ